MNPRWIFILKRTCYLILNPFTKGWLNSKRHRWHDTHRAMTLHETALTFVLRGKIICSFYYFIFVLPKSRFPGPLGGTCTLYIKWRGKKPSSDIIHAKQNACLQLLWLKRMFHILMKALFLAVHFLISVWFMIYLHTRNN